MKIELLKKKKDYKKVAELILQIYPDDDIGKIKDELLRGGDYPYSQFFIARQEKEVIGIAGWCIHEEYKDGQLALELSWLAVKGEYQKNRIATILFYESFQSIKDYWEKQGCKTVMLVAYVNEADEPILSFCRKILSEIGEIKEISVPFWKKPEGGKKNLIYFFVSF